MFRDGKYRVKEAEVGGVVEVEGVELRIRVN